MQLVRNFEDKVAAKLLCLGSFFVRGEILGGEINIRLVKVIFYQARQSDLLARII